MPSLLTILRFLWQKFPLSDRFRRLVDRYYLYPRLNHCRQYSDPQGSQLIIASFFQSGLGIGEAARQQVVALKSAGYSPALFDVSKTFGIKDLPDPGFATTQGLPKQGPILVHVNAPETGLTLHNLGAELTSNRPIIGCWYWELSKPPENWWRAYRYLAELWAPSEFVADIFRKSCPVAVKTIPIPVTVPPSNDMSRREFGLPDAPCIFLCMADCRSDLYRKNIIGCIDAFKAALGNNFGAILLIKLHHAELAPQVVAELNAAIGTTNNIQVVTDLLSRGGVGDLMRCCDVFVSLHRAEGFSLPLAEAMILGKPVIATGYSGNMTFMNRQVSRLVDYKLVPVNASRRVYTETHGAEWADPDLCLAAEYMQELFHDRELQVRLGISARDYVTRQLSPQKLIAALENWFE